MSKQISDTARRILDEYGFACRLRTEAEKEARPMLAGDYVIEAGGFSTWSFVWDGKVRTLQDDIRTMMSW